MVISPKESFLILQIVLVAIGIFLWLRYLRNQDSKLNFRHYGEADNPQSKLKSKTPQPPLQLPGFAENSDPFVVLDLNPDHCTEKQVQAQFRLKIKQYHPDHAGPTGSREWQAAQKIAIQLTEARRQALEKIAARKKR